MTARDDQPAAAVSDEDQAALRFAAANDAGLCTIVSIDGSFSRRLGAQLAVARDGSTIGSMSDGCLEAELANQTRLAAEQGRTLLLRYGIGSPFIDFRLPCGSGLDILVDPHPDRALLGGVVAALDARAPAGLPLPVRSPQLLSDRAYIPSLRVLALGGGSEADWLERLARSYGAEIERIDPRHGRSAGRVPTQVTADHWTAIVLLFHDHEWEAPLLEWSLATEAFYIGALGGAVAREARLEFLAKRGIAPEVRARVRSPLGLIRQTRDARTLALSTLADVVASYEALRE